MNYVNHGNGGMVATSGGYGGAALMDPTANMPKRDTIQQALSEQDKAAQELHAIVSHLEERLHPVLGQPNVTSGNADVAPNPSAVLDRIHSNTRTLYGVGARLSELMQRLQL